MRVDSTQVIAPGEPGNDETKAAWHSYRCAPNLWNDGPPPKQRAPVTCARPMSFTLKTFLVPVTSHRIFQASVTSVVWTFSCPSRPLTSDIRHICCSSATLCDLQDLAVSGPLAPFDEGVSVVFRGPMNLYNIVWFQEKDGSLDKASSWTPT